MKGPVALLVMMIAGARGAAADPHKVLVMQAEGRIDADTLTRIDAAVLKLARASEAQATAGDITYSDAAAAVGCKPEDRTCKDEVIGMLAVDEIVYTTVTPKPGGLEIAVHRATQGSATRDAQMWIAAGQPADRLDGIAPLFGAVAISSRTPPEPTPPEPSSPGPRPPLPGPIGAAPSPAPLQPRDEPERSSGGRRLEIVGMAGGGTMVLLGFLLWQQASSIQGDIDRAPNRTHANLEDLHLLEQRGDRFAAWGNVTFIGGLIVGGISGYYFWKHRRTQRPVAARITPTVFDHGAGIAFSVGGSP